MVMDLDDYCIVTVLPSMCLNYFLRHWPYVLIVKSIWSGKDFLMDQCMAEGLAQLIGDERCCVKALTTDRMERALTNEAAVSLSSEVHNRTRYRYTTRGKF